MPAAELPGALAACAAAVARAPGGPRQELRYARALERAGCLDQARRLYRWAATDGAPGAQAALARLDAARRPPAPPEPGDAAAREGRAARLEAVSAIARRLALATPRDHGDAVAVLGEIGTDPAAILAWVRANTRLVPYAGMLRGARGVLMDRAGNTLDRALLLADLLQQAGYQVRIARASVPALTAAALHARAIATGPRPALPVLPDRDALIRLAAGEPDLDGALRGRAADAAVGAARRFADRVRQLYGAALPPVQTALGDVAARDRALSAAGDRMLVDHFWVQRRVPSGWGDLDPDADVVPRLSAKETFPPDRVPEALHHRVRIRVVLGTAVTASASLPGPASAPAEIVLAERTWEPSALVDGPVVLRHEVLPGLGGACTPGPRWWVEPVLQAAGETIAGRPYAPNGRVLPAGSRPSLDPSLTGVGPDAGPRGAGVGVAAEWLEVTLQVPGRPDVTYRRRVRGAGPTASRGGGLPDIDGLGLPDGDVRILVLAAAPSARWLQQKLGDALARIAERTAWRLRAGPEAELPPISLERLSLPLWSWAVSRKSMGVLREAVPTAPNVALLWGAPEGPDGRVDGRVDVLANEVGLGAGFAQHVAQGVLDAAIERAVPGVGDVSAAVRALRAAGPWVPVDRSRAAVLDDLRLSHAVRSAVDRDLRHGNIVLLPPSAVSGRQAPADEPVAWWRIDPATGATLGVAGGSIGGAAPVAGAAVDPVQASAGLQLVQGALGYLVALYDAARQPEARR